MNIVLLLELLVGEIVKKHHTFSTTNSTASLRSNCFVKLYCTIGSFYWVPNVYSLTVSHLSGTSKQNPSTVMLGWLQTQHNLKQNRPQVSALPISHVTVLLSFRPITKRAALTSQSNHGDFWRARQDRLTVRNAPLDCLAPPQGVWQVQMELSISIARCFSFTTGTQSHKHVQIGEESIDTLFVPAFGPYKTISVLTTFTATSSLL